VIAARHITCSPWFFDMVFGAALSPTEPKSLFRYDLPNSHGGAGGAPLESQIETMGHGGGNCEPNIFDGLCRICSDLFTICSWKII
jgi:hypothetical protein